MALIRFNAKAQRKFKKSWRLCVEEFNAKAQSRKILEAIDDAVDAMFNQPLSEVNHQSEFQASQPQIGQHL